MPKPVWWQQKDAARACRPLKPRTYRRPFHKENYQANFEAKNMVRWGVIQANRRVSLSAMNETKWDIACSDGTPLDRLLAWEEVERRLCE